MPLLKCGLNHDLEALPGHCGCLRDAAAPRGVNSLVVQPYRVPLPIPTSALTCIGGSQAGVGQGANEVWISKNKAETPFKDGTIP